MRIIVRYYERFQINCPKVLSLDVSSFGTIGDVKDELANSLKIRPAEQLLTLQNHHEHLPNVRRLEDCGISEGSVLSLTEFGQLRPTQNGTDLQPLSLSIRTTWNRFTTQRWSGAPPEQQICRIPGTEHRGITFKQLCAILEFIECRVEFTANAMGLGGHGEIGDWYSALDGHPLCFESINLYDVVHWIVGPSTSAYSCSYVEFIAFEVDKQRPCWFISHWWGEPVLSFIRCVSAHMWVRDAEIRNKAGVPSPDDAPYWVCAYANNQHELGTDLTRDPRETSFFRAMRLCVGVLLVLDGNCTPFSRIWCCFEEWVALKDRGRPEPMLLDIAIDHEGATATITQGLTLEDCVRDDFYRQASLEEEAWVKKSRRELSFPLEATLKPLDVHIEDAQASQQLDKVRILNCICGKSDAGLDDPLPETVDADHRVHYEQVNRSLRAIFAEAALRQVLADGLKSGVLANVMQALRDDVEKDSLNICLSGLWSDEIMDEIGPVDIGNEFLVELGDVVGSMVGLRRLSVNCAFLASINDEGVNSLSVGMQQVPDLAHVVLNLSNCQITERGLESFSRRMPMGLESFHLNVDGCGRIGGGALCDLAGHLPRCLQAFNISCRSSMRISSFHVGTFLRSLAFLPLQNLSLGFANCGLNARDMYEHATYVGLLPTSLLSLHVDLSDNFELQDGLLVHLVRNLPKQLKSLSLNIRNCHPVTNKFIRELCSALQSGRAGTSYLKEIRLNLIGCASLGRDSIGLVCRSLPPDIEDVHICGVLYCVLFLPLCPDFCELCTLPVAAFNHESPGCLRSMSNEITYLVAASWPGFLWGYICMLLFASLDIRFFFCFFFGFLVAWLLLVVQLARLERMKQGGYVWTLLPIPKPCPPLLSSLAANLRVFYFFRGFGELGVGRRFTVRPSVGKVELSTDHVIFARMQFTNVLKLPILLVCLLILVARGCLLVKCVMFMAYLPILLMMVCVYGLSLLLFMGIVSIAYIVNIFLEYTKLCNLAANDAFEADYEVVSFEEDHLLELR